jgi:predicted dehydrogenase
MPIHASARIGVGLIGAGKHGQRYLKHIHEDVPELRVWALWRRDRKAGEAQARAVGATFHDDWRALVADPAVDAVVAAVPPSLHLPIVEEVAAARKALLIEKPLSTTGANARTIVRIVRRAGIPVLMAHTLRWNSVVRTVQGALPALGPLRALVVNQRFEPSVLEWLDDPTLSGAGIILHTGVHSFDLVRFLTGHEVLRVWCRTAQANTRRTEDHFNALFELDGSGAQVAVNGSRATRGRSGLVDAACAEGQLLADHQQHWAHTVVGLERTPLGLPPPAMTVREVAAAFAALIRHGVEPPARVEDGARSVLIAEACLRSAQRGGSGVDVEPLEP